MKSIAKITLATILIVVALIAGFTKFCYHLENIVPEESGLVRHPELQPFLVGRIGFRGIRYNFDSNFYSFAFPTSLSGEAYFDAIHKGASREGWELVNLETFKRVYRRRSNAYPAARHYNKVTLAYNPEKSEVTFIEEEDYSE